MTRLITSRKALEEYHKQQYTHLGLSDNPFPVDAIINRKSPDPRVNGSIFTPEIRQGVIQDFESKLLGKSNPIERYRLGYLWSQGDQALGRGVGKTALLSYLQKQVNLDWGENYFQKNFPTCALYVYPEPGMNKLEYISVLAMQELVAQGVLDSVVANLRYQILLREWTRGEVKAVQALKPEEGHLLLDSDWLIEQGFDLLDLDDGIVDLLVTAGVEETFARAVAAGELLAYLKTMRKDGQLTFPAPPRDTLLYHKANQLFFTQSMRTLKAAGYQGTYLFIDDIENVIDKMGRRERENFAKELGYILLRGEYEAGVSRFLTIVLTTHAAAAQRLSEAWGLAGLQASLPMSLDAPNSILVPILSMAEAKEVVKRYLAHYQLNSQLEENSLHPFSEEAVELLVEHSNYHPREFLSKAHFILEQAKLQPQLTQIEAGFVEWCLTDSPGIVNGFNESIDVSLL